MEANNTIGGPPYEKQNEFLCTSLTMAEVPASLGSSYEIRHSELQDNISQRVIPEAGSSERAEKISMLL